MMWKCPKCGREFRKQNQEHYCTKLADIDEYIAFQEEGIQPYLKQIRETIGSAIPEARENFFTHTNL